MMTSKLKVVFISDAQNNDVFNALSVVPTMFELFVRVFVGDKVPRHYNVLTLSYPHNFFLYDIYSKHHFSGAPEGTHSLPDTYAHKGLPWNMGFELALRERQSHVKSLEAARRAAGYAKDVERTRGMLQTEILRNETLAKQNRTLSERNRRLTEQKTITTKNADRVTCTQELVRSEVEAMRKMVRTLREELLCIRDGVIELRNASLPPLPANKLEVLLQTAAQCSHYFSHDYYSSAHFRKLLDAEGRINVSDLSGFPRIQGICGGDVETIEAACKLAGVGEKIRP
jgi:hypothetical protein